MSLYEQFRDEASFSTNFIRPLLNKLGFFLVAEYHGRREFGKDFVFSELHRFGGIRHYAAQVKHKLKIAGGKAISDLQTDIDQAFTNPFKLPDSPEDAYISAFYIFSSGTITDEAKYDLINRVRVSAYRGNVYLLDGERLDSLNKWATFQNDQYVRHRLSGLRNQLMINIKIWDSIREDAGKNKFGEARGSMLAGIETFLSSPIFPERISENDVIQLWQRARIIDSICSRYLLGTRVTEEIRKQDTKKVSELAGKSIFYAQKIISEIEGVIAELKPL